MANLDVLDKQRRLTPWLEQSHADYVNGEYGRMLATTPEKAEAYVNDYRVREKEDKENRKRQLDFVRNQQKAQGLEPSEAGEEVKYLEWVPSIRLANEKAKKEEAAADETEADGSDKPKKARKKENVA